MILVLVGSVCTSVPMKFRPKALVMWNEEKEFMITF